MRPWMLLRESIASMERDEISLIAHTDHPLAAPLSEESARGLLRSAGSAETVLDLGCGRGVWLTYFLQMNEAARAVGVDISGRALRGAEGFAAERGVGARARWVEADATAWTENENFDVVICVGATHAFDGLDGTLTALKRHVRDGGSVVLGGGFWERPPSAITQEVLEAGPDDFPDIAGFATRVEQAGFDIVDGHISTLEEWDRYEWSWTGSLVRWAMDESHPQEDRDEALEVARSHRDGWLRGYRGELGFATLVLAST